MATFKADLGGYREFHRTATGMHAGLTHFATAIEARAQGYARVEDALSAASHNRTPGKFRDSIHTERHRGPTYQTVRVVADCDGAAAIEARDRVLGRAEG